ncbi:MAG TPA: SDR family oxidoreductase [Holophagaceae bacterium]|nr:SDR family oxidoreductase [Holophagaceae bacterium]
MPVALVSGAGGIGTAVVGALRGRGWQVAVLGRDATRNAATGADLPLTGDATRSEDLQLAVETTLATYGRLDGLAHSVGSLLLKPGHLTRDEDFDELLRVNLGSAFRAARAALRPMVQQGSGSIVLVSSVAALAGLPNHEAIGAAKGGVAALAANLAATYASKGIRVNAVAPGLTRTPLTERIFRSETALQASLALHPLGRAGEPGDVAALIAFLLSIESGWITGAHLPVDGGLTGLRTR